VRTSELRKQSTGALSANFKSPCILLPRFKLRYPFLRTGSSTMAYLSVMPIMMTRDGLSQITRIPRILLHRRLIPFSTQMNMVCLVFGNVHTIPSFDTVCRISHRKPPLARLIQRRKCFRCLSPSHRRNVKVSFPPPCATPPLSLVF
jgi:hypothetical protein